MASQGDRPESAHTLPRPELNPLLNPLLADNMGRWAEVYFTSPPEKREEAVLELLRELGAEAPQPEGSSPSPSSQERTHSPDPEVHTLTSEAEPLSLSRCQSCGHDNPATHTFCGMCGCRLAQSIAPERQSPGDPSGEQEPAGVDGGSELPASPTGDRPEARFSPPFRASARPEENEGELSLFRSFSAHASADDFDPEPPARPYRLYIGAGLAIIILALGYMAWRGGHTQDSHEAPPPPPVTAAESGNPAPVASSNAQAAPPSSPKADDQSNVQFANKAASDSANSASSANSPVATKAHDDQAAEKASKPAESAADSSKTQAPAANGSAELAMAQRYLTGINGQERDSAEAAKWLWKSMAKHNAAASLLLADLYLKGDGVSKNCDQARVLLDSAARRGIPAAGDRLRNLQAFGCQ